MRSERKGRPGAQPIPSELLQAVKTYSYSGNPFVGENPEDYKEAELREVVSVISRKIRQYIIRNPNDNKFASLIEPKLGDAFEEYRNGNYHAELLDVKTLKRCFVDMVSSETTRNILLAFQIVRENEEQRKHDFARIKGLYYILTTHSTLPGTFQVSLAKISEEGSFLKHITNRRKLEMRPLFAEMVSSRNLLLTFREDNTALFFYLFIGTISQPAFLQAAILYSNLYDNVVSNLAVFARIKEMGEKEEKDFIEKFVPQRELEKMPDIISDLVRPIRYVEQDPNLTLRENIQYFLLHRARPLATKTYHNIVPFDFSQSIAVEPGPYGQDAKDYSRAKAYVDNYYIYFNERFKSTPEMEGDGKIFDKSRQFSTVGKGLFSIYVDEKTGVLKASMRTRKDREGHDLKHEGFVINTRLGVSPYLLMSLYSGQKDERCIVLLLRIIDDNKMTGGHVIAYSPWGKLGAGAVFLVRRSTIDKDGDISKEPQAFIPFAPNVKKGLEEKIVNYLSLSRQGLVVPPEYEDIETKGGSIKYEGLYKVYFGKKDPQQVGVSLLRIYRNGFATHEDGWGDKAVGRAEPVNNVLNIILKNAANANLMEGSQRTGFCCVKVDAEIPLVGKVYMGTFAGISRSDETPIASLFIMEFCGKLDSTQHEAKQSVAVESLPVKVQEFFKAYKMNKLTFLERDDQITEV